MLTEAIAGAGFSPAGRHAKVPPRQASGHLTSLKRARTCQGSLPDPAEVQYSITVTSYPARFSAHTDPPYLDTPMRALHVHLVGQMCLDD